MMFLAKGASLHRQAVSKLEQPVWPMKVAAHDGSTLGTDTGGEGGAATDRDAEGDATTAALDVAVAGGGATHIVQTVDTLVM